MTEFAPGMRTVIRDEEWMIKKITTNSMGNKTLHCIGISTLVKDKEALFLSDLEDIKIVDPAAAKLVPDTSSRHILSEQNGIPAGGKASDRLRSGYQDDTGSSQKAPGPCAGGGAA